MLTYGTVITGAEASWTLYLTMATGWPDGAEEWTWTLRLAASGARDELAAEAEMESATLSADGKMLTLRFVLSGTAAAGLGPGLHYVDCVADDGAGLKAWEAAHGVAAVRGLEGGLPDGPEE